jgi:RNA polymerase sigma-70 factor (ECF subfamily)
MAWKARLATRAQKTGDARRVHLQEVMTNAGQESMGADGAEEARRSKEERALLTRAAAGEVQAFEPIVTTYRSRAYQFAFTMTRNHHDALDLSQEAFVRAFRNLKRYDTSRRFLPWFLRILRNLCLTSIDKRQRLPANPGPVESDEVLQFIPAPSPGPDARAARRDLAEEIAKAMETLSPAQREVLHLRHFEDLSYEEIADCLGIPVGTVMSRLFHGRRKLAEVLRRRGVVA